MTNFLYFAENLVTTGGNRAARSIDKATDDPGSTLGAGGDTACMLRADSYLGAEPVGATQTRLFFADPIRMEGSDKGRISITLTHANTANGGGFKNVVRAVGAAINRSNPGNSGFVVFADEENDNTTIAGAEIKTGGVEYDPNFAACSPDSSTLTAGLGAVAIGKSRPVSQEQSGPGVVSTDFGAPEIRVYHNGPRVETLISFSVKGLAGVATAADAIGLAAGGAAYLMQWNNEINGVCTRAELSCVKAPTGGGSADIAIVSHADNDKIYDNPLGTDYIADFAGAATAGKTIVNNNPALVDNEHVYISTGDGSFDTNAMTNGFFTLSLHGHLEKGNQQ